MSAIDLFFCLFRGHWYLQTSQPENTGQRQGDFSWMFVCVCELEDCIGLIFFFTVEQLEHRAVMRGRVNTVLHTDNKAHLTL